MGSHYVSSQFIQGTKTNISPFALPKQEAIDSYLSYRIRAGEQLNDQSPLFRRDFRADDLFKAPNNIKPIKTDAVSKTIQTILRESGLLSKYQTITVSQGLTRHEVQRNHGFRKFANTQMILAEVNGAAKEMLLVTP